ncbi:MAG: hypothetical protein ACOYOD_10175 [Saprospiraceae bacterium]|jgi:hypothetical protein
MNRVRPRRLCKQSVFRLLPLTAALLFFCVKKSFSTSSDSLFICIPPSDTALYCSDPLLAQLGRLGTPSASLSVPSNIRLLELPVQRSLDACQKGSIVRSWQFVQDTLGRQMVRGPVCSQRIQVQPLQQYAVFFPADTAISCTNLGKIDSARVVYGQGCDYVTVSVQDALGANTSGSCFRIYRKYLVINWCEFDGSGKAQQVSRDADGDGTPGSEAAWLLVRPAGQASLDRDTVPGNGYWTSTSEDSTFRSNGYWEYIQVIDVVDTIPPLIGIASRFTASGTRADCTAEAGISFQVLEPCSAGQLRLEFEWDLYSNGNPETDVPYALSGTYPRYRLLARLPLGTHRLRIRAHDACGNTSEKTVEIEVLDRRGPEFKCVNSLVLNLIPLAPGIDADGDGDADAGAVTLWADNLIAGPASDCSFQVRYSIHRAEWVEAGVEKPNPDQGSLVLTCDDRPTVLIYIYAWDNAGNANYCETYILLNDPTGKLCPVLGKGSISGAVYDRSGRPFQGAEVVLDGEKVARAYSGKEGAFSFSALKEGAAYQLRGNLDTLCREGVSTHDIVKIMRHILGEEVFTDPYRFIAADVDRSGTITTLDVILIRKLVLGLDRCFALCPSWVFIKAYHTFSDPSNPLKSGLPEQIWINQLSGNVLKADFIAVKMGDVTGDALSGIKAEVIYREKSQQATDGDEPLPTLLPSKRLNPPLQNRSGRNRPAQSP